MTESLEEKADIIFIRILKEIGKSDSESMRLGAFQCIRSSATLARTATNGMNIQNAAACIQEALAHSLAADLFLSKMGDTEHINDNF